MYGWHARAPCGIVSARASADYRIGYVPLMSSPRTQQRATRAAFFIPGLLIAAWAPIVPFAKARAGLDDAALGLVLLCLGTGSLLAMPAAGVLATRYGCRAIMLASVAVMVCTLPALAATSTAWSLGVTLLLFGAAIGAMDCTMNLQAVAVERDAGRALMSGFHAFYSIGSLVGAVVATVLLGAGVGVLPMTLAMATVAVSIAAVAATAWSARRAPHGAPALAIPKGAVIAIGAVCFVTFLAEGAMLDWSAVFLHELRAVDVSHAGWGFVVFNIAMMLSRLLGDRIVTALGRPATVLAGGLVGALGLAFATLGPGLWSSHVGYALLGLGCANIVPVMFTLAGRQRAMPENIAIPAVTTLGYAGVLLGPAAIGFIAHGASLSAAFVVVAGLLMAAAVLGARLARPGAE